MMDIGDIYTVEIPPSDGREQAELCPPGQHTGASGGKPRGGKTRLREHLLSGLWGVADPAVGLERAPVQVEGQEVPPLRADHSGGDGHCGAVEMSRALTCLSLCAKMGVGGGLSGVCGLALHCY